MTTTSNRETLFISLQKIDRHAYSIEDSFHRRIEKLQVPAQILHIFLGFFV